MKIKIVFGLLSLFLVIFIGLLFIPSNKNLKIITSPKIFSLLKSSNNESIEVELLVNKTDTYYFDKDYIFSISLNSEFDVEIIPLVIDEITYGNSLYDYDNDTFYLVNLSLSVGFESDDYLIDFKKAYLDISYNNEENLKLFIGEFNYLFMDDITNNLGISNLSSTVYKSKEINTVSGVYIELYNMSNENLVINNFNLGSSSVLFNNYYLSEIYNEPDLFDTVEEILLIENYDFYNDSSSYNKSLLLRENQSIILYVPLVYSKEIEYIHRFFFEVNYTSNQGEKSLIIDDIPYVSTSIFQTSLEEGYFVYEIPN